MAQKMAVLYMALTRHPVAIRPSAMDLCKRRGNCTSNRGELSVETLPSPDDPPPIYVK